MSIVTADFPEGAIDVTKAYDAFEWRRHQPLLGRCDNFNCGDALVSQRLDGGDTTMALDVGQCTDNNCTVLTQNWDLGFYSHSSEPLDCLNKFSDPFGNRSDLIIVSKWDYLSEQSTAVANSSHSMLYVHWIDIEAQLGFKLWKREWYCGTTNSFDCTFRKLTENVRRVDQHNRPRYY
jgi:hypothetical protein